MLKIEIKKLVNFIKKHNIFSIFLILLFISISSFIFYYFNNLKRDTPFIELYKEIFYLQIFIYLPFIYISMEHFFKSKSIIFLKNFAIPNKKLVNHLFFLFVVKMLPIYLLQIVAILPFYSKDINFFKAAILLITLYHLLFLVLSIFIYGYAAIIMMNDELTTLRDNISGGWSDGKLAPMLFAPAVLLASLNFINIILSKVIERVFWSETISFGIFVLIVTIVLFILFFKGKRNLTYFLKRVYATISEFHNLYIDGSYNIENGFKEERFLNKFFSNNNFLILKEFKVLKRGFRLQSLLVYITPFILYLLFSNIIDATSFKKNIIVIFIYLILTLPIIKIYYTPFEYSHKKTIFPISIYRIMSSKVIASLLYIWPFIVSLIIFGVIYQNMLAFYLVSIFIVQNIFTIYIPHKRVVELFTTILSILFLYL